MTDLFDIVTEAYAKINEKKILLSFAVSNMEVSMLSDGLPFIVWGKCVGDPDGVIAFNGCYDFGAAKRLAKQICQGAKERKEWVDAEGV
jgi:hypothetical protein